MSKHLSKADMFFAGFGAGVFFVCVAMMLSGVNL